MVAVPLLVPPSSLAPIGCCPGVAGAQKPWLSGKALDVILHARSAPEEDVPPYWVTTALGALLGPEGPWHAFLCARQHGALEREGRRCMAWAYGVPLAALGSSLASSSRPVDGWAYHHTAHHGARVPALDRPSLAETCAVLELHLPPWSPVSLANARAARVLVLAGALSCGCRSREDPDECWVAAWILHHMTKILQSVSRRQQAVKAVTTAARLTAGAGARSPSGSRKWLPFSKVRRPASAPLRSPRRPAKQAYEYEAHPEPAARRPWLQGGDRVRAHWVLPHGGRSLGIEDAVVLEADPDRARVRLLYDDGPDLWVPASWVVQSPLSPATPGDVTLPRQPPLLDRATSGATFGVEGLGTEWP